MMFFLALCIVGFLSCNAQDACGPGNFVDPADGLCKLCPLNTFSRGNETSSCKSCPNDKITLETGATSDFQCVCKAGYGAYMPYEECRMCPTGTYNDAKGNGTEAGHDMPMDPYMMPMPMFMCKPCPQGYTNMERGATDVSSCTECQPGYLRNDSATPDTCEPCAKGTYSSSPNDTSCTSCPEGETTSREGSTQPWECHTECKAGQYYTGSRCYDCWTGSYAPAGKDDHCIPCPRGYKTPGRGATSEADCTECSYGYGKKGTVCERCELGTYYSSGRCVSCPTGKTTTQTGATSSSSCVCAAGYYERRRYSWSSTRDCVACAVGSYSADVGATSCKQCPRGMSTKSIAQTSSSACVCEAGTYLDTNEQVCVRCGVGTYSETGATECTECPPGTNCMFAGGSSVNACVCQPGYFVNPATGTCQACPPGSFSNSTAEHICTRCPLGLTTNVDQTGCE